MMYMKDTESYTAIKTAIQHLDAVAAELSSGYLFSLEQEPH